MAVAPAVPGRGVAPTPSGGGGGGPSIPSLPTPPIAPGLGDIDSGDGDKTPRGLPAHAPDLLCVTFSRGTAQSIGADFAKTFGLTIVDRYEMSGLRLQVVLMQLAAGADFAAVLGKAGADKRARSVQPDYLFASLDGSSGGGSQQYALERIGASHVPAAARGQGVTVAVIDSGVDKAHESLKGTDITAIDAIQNGASPPPETHGTVITSIIAGNGKVRGLAPAAHILAIRAFVQVDPESGASTSDSFHLSKAISLALDNHARIINLSLGGPNDPLVRLAVEQAVLTGTMVIAAAGNSGPDAPPVYPAAQRGVVAVTATDDKDRIYPGANRGEYITLAAPGVAVFAAKPGTTSAGAYDYFTGTSMAAGYASGLAAVLFSADPKLTAVDVLKVLETSSTDLGAPKKDPEFGWGRIDAAAAYLETPEAGATN